MKYASDNPITNLLLAGCLLLMAIFAAEWLIPYPVNAMDTGESGAAIVDEIPAAAQSRYVHPHIGNYAEILARPIFFSNRQLPPEAVTKAQAPRTPLRLKLEGIAIATDTRVAVLRDQGNNQLLQLSVGMSHDNWLLENITTATATFRRGDDVTSISLNSENR